MELRDRAAPEAGTVGGAETSIWLRKAALFSAV